MGYSTEFSGRFDVAPRLTPEMIDYLNRFSCTRRMARDSEIIKDVFPDWQDNCFFGNLGEEGEYFIGGVGAFGQDRDESVIDHNNAPASQPGLWCQWVPTEDGSAIEWDGGEKFYAYVPWLQYIIEHFLSPEGYVLNGEVEYRGEDFDDRGVICVENNMISLYDA